MFTQSWNVEDFAKPDTNCGTHKGKGSECGLECLCFIVLG